MHEAREGATWSPDRAGETVIAPITEAASTSEGNGGRYDGAELVQQAATLGGAGGSTAALFGCRSHYGGADRWAARTGLQLLLPLLLRLLLLLQEHAARVLVSPTAPVVCAGVCLAY